MLNKALKPNQILSIKTIALEEEKCIEKCLCKPCCPIWPVLQVNAFSILAVALNLINCLSHTEFSEHLDCIQPSL